MSSESALPAAGHLFFRVPRVRDTFFVDWEQHACIIGNRNKNCTLCAAGLDLACRAMWCRCTHHTCARMPPAVNLNISIARHTRQSTLLEDTRHSIGHSKTRAARKNNLKMISKSTGFTSLSITPLAAVTFFHVLTIP